MQALPSQAQYGSRARQQSAQASPYTSQRCRARWVTPTAEDTYSCYCWGQRGQGEMLPHPHCTRASACLLFWCCGDAGQCHSWARDGICPPSPLPRALTHPLGGDGHRLDGCWHLDESRNEEDGGVTAWTDTTALGWAPQTPHRQLEQAEQAGEDVSGQQAGGPMPGVPPELAKRWLLSQGTG